MTTFDSYTGTTQGVSGHCTCMSATEKLTNTPRKVVCDILAVSWRLLHEIIWPPADLVHHLKKERAPAKHSDREICCDCYRICCLSIFAPVARPYPKPKN
eukprot:g3570.t1